MTFLEILSTTAQLLSFIALSIILFTLPGLIALKTTRISLSNLEKVTIATTIGLFLFTLCAFLLSLIQIGFLTGPLFALSSILWILKNIKSHHFKTLPKPTLNFPLIFIFTLGLLGQLAIVAPNGYPFAGSIYFWSAQGHDGIWHIALIEELKNSIPPQNPVLSGEKLINYHFFSDIASAQFSNIFKYSSLDLYFRFFPLLYSLLFGLSAFILGRKIGQSSTSGLWTTFFAYFSGSFGYIYTLIKYGKISGETTFWATQVQSSIGNPPQIISNIAILTILFLLLSWLKKPSLRASALLIILCSTLALFKIYASIVLLSSLLTLGILTLILKKDFRILTLSLPSLALSAILYLPFTKSSSSFLIWEPWWFVRTMIVAKDKLDWVDLELRRQTYIAENNLKRVIFLETIAGLIFIFGNLGTKFIGLVFIFTKIKLILKDRFHQLLLLIAALSPTFPLLFLQKGVAGNTIQFMQYFLLVFCIYAGLSTALILHKLKNGFLRLLFIILLILLSFPTQFGLILENHTRTPYAKISTQELEALNFLKSLNGNGVILTPPYNKDFQTKQTIPIIWDWSDTAYVSALSGKRTYISDIEQVDIMGYDYKNRLNIQQNIFSATNPQDFNSLLAQTGSKFVYFPTVLKPTVDLKITTLKQIYSNPDVEIWATP